MEFAMFKFNVMPRIVREGEGFSGGGSGFIPAGSQIQNRDNQNQQQNNQNQQGNQQPQKETHGQDHVDNFDNFWQNPNRGQEDSNKQGTQETQGAQNTQQGDPNKVLDDYLASKSYFHPNDMSSAFEAAQQGDTEAFNGVIQKSMQAMYKDVLMDTTKIINQRVSQAVNEAVSKSTGGYKTDMAMQSLTERLPYVSDSAIRPIAQAALTRALGQGLSLDAAIDKVDKYFQHINDRRSGKSNTTPPNGRGGNNFGNGRMPTGDETDANVPDFMAILTGA